MEARSPSSSQRAMNMLFLTVPDQHEDNNPAVLLDEKLLRGWLSGLPMMNVVQTVEMLHHAILPFNELRLEPHQRLKLLECYREKVDEIFYSYDEMRLKQLPVSHEARQTIKSDIMWLYLELANGYKIEVKSAMDRGSNPKKDAGLLLAIYRAMEQIIHALINAYRNAQSPPPLAYLEIHQLYRVAAVHNAVDKKIRGVKQETATPSINHLYKQCMLLAVADPISMADDLAFELFFLLEQFADSVSITHAAPTDWDRQVYVLDFSEDARPRYRMKTDSLQKNDDEFFLDIEPAIEKINIRLREIEKDNQGIMGKQETRLLEIYKERVMNVHGKGKYKNESVGVYLSFGLKSTHYFMCGDNLPRYLASSQENFGIEVRDVNEVDEIHDLEAWKITEISNSGKMLLVPEGHCLQEPVIGMVVGVFEHFDTGKPAFFTLGTVAWLPPVETNDKKIGIQIMPGRPEPVSCTEIQSGTLFSGVHIPEVKVLNLSASLVVPSENYIEDKVVTLRQGSTERAVRLDAPIDITDGIVHCYYRIES